MKFGVFSVSMPEYGIEESVRLLKELGYDGVEWRVAEMPEKEPENVPFALRYWACNKKHAGAAQHRGRGGKGQGPVRRGRAGDLRPDDLPCHQ